MKKKILSIGVFLLLIVTVIPASSSLIDTAANGMTQNPTDTIESDTCNQIPSKHYEALSENYPPEKPATPTGRTQGKPGVPYIYTTTTTDPDGDQVYYFWNWGDGTQSEWIGPYASGTTINTNHTWAAQGSYNITVKAKDTHRLESWWSDPLPIAMPFSYNPLLHFLELLFQRFPNAFSLLRHLLEIL